MFGLGTTEMLIIGIVAVLLFGKRLPEVGRSLGKGIVEFKKGIRGIEDEVDSASTKRHMAHYDDDHEEATAPKFEPPTSAPQPETADDQPVKA
jgi:sec-independent protein translocase protein TatA